VSATYFMWTSPRSSARVSVQAKDDAEKVSPVPRMGILRCMECGNTVECDEVGLLRFSHTKKWLRCCGEVMTLFMPVDAPNEVRE